MRAAILLLLFAAWLPCQQDDLLIGTWNLEQFGFRKDPPRGDAELDAMAAVVRDLGVAVLAVQEVGSEAVLADLARRVGPKWRAVLGQSGGFRDSTGRMSVGFLWNDAVVELLRAEELSGLPRDSGKLPIFHRVPVTAAFQVRGGGSDFRLVTVHFKAGQKPEDDQKRLAEAGALRDWVTTLLGRAGEDQDLAILGDFNHGYDTAPCALLQGAGLQYLRRDGEGPTIAHFDTPIDQIAAWRGFDELDRGAYDVWNEAGLRDKQAWMDRTSDHFPVRATLRVGSDDDGAATFAPSKGATALAPLAVAVAANASAPAPAATAAPRAPASAAFAVGTRVLVATDDGESEEGKLLEPLPDGAGGWVVIESRGKRIAIPMAKVRKVSER